MEQHFQQILKHMEVAYQGVVRGNMMKSPALSVRSKVFAFFHQNEMGFKLDQKASYFKDQYPDSRYLNPFKNKPPMKGWLIIPSKYHSDWSDLAIEAYLNMIEK